MIVKKGNQNLKLDLSKCCYEVELVIGNSENIKKLRVLGIRKEILLELNTEVSCLGVCANILKVYDITIERA